MLWYPVTYCDCNYVEAYSMVQYKQQEIASCSSIFFVSHIAFYIQHKALGLYVKFSMCWIPTSVWHVRYIFMPNDINSSKFSFFPIK